MKGSLSWTSPFKSPTSSTLCFGKPTLGKLNQVKLLCSSTSSTLCVPTLAKLNQETELCITMHILFVTLLFRLELPSLCQALPLKQAEFPTATLA